MAWIAHKWYKITGEGISPFGEILKIESPKNDEGQELVDVRSITEIDHRGFCKFFASLLTERLFTTCLCDLQFVYFAI